MNEIKAQPPCPECEKLVAVSKESNKIGEFLSWLESSYYICESSGKNEWVEYLPVHKTLNQWLAEYFDIDLDKVERERKALLDWIREQHEKASQS